MEHPPFDIDTELLIPNQDGTIWAPAELSFCCRWCRETLILNSLGDGYQSKDLYFKRSHEYCAMIHSDWLEVNIRTGEVTRRWTD